MRSRAEDLVTHRAGAAPDHEIRRNLDKEIDGRALDQPRRGNPHRGRCTSVSSICDPQCPRRQPDESMRLKVGRLRQLETLDLATSAGPGQWVVVRECRARRCASWAMRGDIIKRMHRGLTERGIGRGAASYVLDAEKSSRPSSAAWSIKGLDDELKGDGLCRGRRHGWTRPSHQACADLEAFDMRVRAAIVEVRKFDDAQRRRRVRLPSAPTSTSPHQITAPGATWLDRQAIEREPMPLAMGGFGAEVRQAMDRRAEHLVSQGLAERQTRGVSFSRNLIDTLRQREVEALGEKLATETGRQHRPRPQLASMWRAPIASASRSPPAASP
jgi:hypothetical protein